MAYIGNGPGSIRQGRRAVYEFTSTANQTAYSGVDANGLTLDLLQANSNDVFLNGVRLIITDDYTVSGDVLTLVSGAASGDKLIVTTQDEIGNTASYSKAASDSRYVNYDGDVVNGTIQMGGSGNNITFADNNKAIFGAGSDLNVFHNGSHSYVQDSGTGNLYLAGSNVIISNPTSSETMAYFDDDGGASLWYDNAVKIATNNTGVAVTGNITASGLTVSGNVGVGVTPSDTFGFGKALDIGSAAGSFIYVRDTDATNAVGGIGISGTRMYITNKAAGPMTFQVNGDATERMRIDSSGDVGIGTTSPNGSRLYLEDNHTTNVTNSATLIGNTTFTINGNSGEGSDVMRMGPMSLAGAYFIDVSNGGASAEYPLLLNPISGGQVGFGTTTFVDGSKFQFEAAKTFSSGIPRGQVNIVDTTAVATGVGGSISFVGNYSGTSKTTFGSIEGSKINGTGGHYGGALVLKSRSHGGNNVERIRLDSDGLKFNGDTGAGNGLSDFETGSWAPAFISGTIGYSQQAGSYVKIGRLVTLQFNIGSSSVSGMTSYLRIGGLPFNPVDGPYGAGAYTANLLNTSDGPSSLSRYGNDQIGILGSNNSGGNWTWEPASIIVSGTTIRGTFSYETTE